MRSGRPRTVEDEAVAELITETLSRKPKAATHRSVRGIPKKPGFQEHRPSPVSALRAATSPHPQLQAFPPIPSSSRSCEGITHDYQRHGTTTLFAALNVLDGAVIAQCKPRHRHQEFLAFLRHIEANAPAQRDVHLVVDNLATHKHPKVKVWLARRPRWYIHFTPTYASWLNQVERFFALITQRSIRRGSFGSTADLVKKKRSLHPHSQCKFTTLRWTGPADAILQKLAPPNPSHIRRGRRSLRIL
jgi:putative transposase